MRSIAQYVQDAAEQRPVKAAIVGADRTVTFAQLHQEALANAQALRDLGIATGDRVGVCMEKSVDQVCVIAGILMANAVLVPILPRLKSANVRHIIEDSGMAAVITDVDRLTEIAEFDGQVRIIIGRGDDERWPSLRALRVADAVTFYDRIGADNAAIIYSSGSTGRPKGILIAHRNLADGADIVSSYLGTDEHDRIGCLLSFNFDYGLNQLWQTLRTRATLYLHHLTAPEEFFALIERERITALPLMPVIITNLFKSATAHPYDLSSVRYVCSTGGRLSAPMLHDIATTFPDAQMFSMFGLTEAFRSTFLAPDQLATRPTSIGKAIPDNEVLVLDEKGNECAPGVLGELVHRGSTVTKGYWNDPEKTAKTFRTHPRYPGETLVYSGDKVTRDEDGFLFYVARGDEMIKTKGIRVSPTEVECEVARHPDVEHVMAFAVPDESNGEVIGCAYTSRSGRPINEVLMMEFLRAMLPRHMIPTHVLHFESFPITGNAGKLERKTIKQTALQRLGL